MGTRRLINGLVGMGLLASAWVIAAPTSADAACNYSLSTGVTLYTEANCSGSSGNPGETFNGQTSFANLKTGLPAGQSWIQRMGAVLIAKKNSSGNSEVIKLWDAPNTTGSYIGLTNGSTTTAVLDNLSSFGRGASDWYHSDISGCIYRNPNALC